MTGIGTDRFKIGPLKMLGDGALGARTAFLSRPYADDPSTCGIPVFTQETMDEMIATPMHTACRLQFTRSVMRASTAC